MKKFFNITNNYKFEANDLRALVTVINVILIMKFGLTVAWFGFIISMVGLIEDFVNKNRHFNGFIMHLSNVVLNLFFMMSC